MLIKIKCPKCDADNNFSLLDADYHGPYRCWKCRELFVLTVKGGEFKSCEPTTQEEMDKLKEIEDLKAKFRRR